MIPLLAQQNVRDLAPPIQYSIIPLWMIFAGSVLGLLLLGFIIWLGMKFFPRRQRVQTPRERALDVLARIETQLEQMPPYRFSIAVSDILRRYVLEQFDLPMTRQTSIEFLNTVASAKNFSEEDKTLLADFLNRCDLIKFARYEATVEDSRRLLEEARRFVKGGTLVSA